MRRIGRVVSALQILWSGPQFPFLARYMRPEDRGRENPRRISAPDATVAILVVVAVAVAAILVTAMVFAALMPTFP